ncbi:MAG TPA: chromate transporter [Methylomirabilota bacterium]|jgi:chromate transporter|nr:chromate transporter [Methylomirabilota bacterium]
MTERRIRLSRIFQVFAWTGLTSIGGGRYAFFYDAVVIRRQWLRTSEFVQDLTLSQLLPGPNFSNLAVALGARLGGGSGALVGAVALILPGALILLTLAALYFRGGFTPTLTHAMRGAAAAVVGLVLVATASIIPASLRGWRALLVAAAVFVLVGPLRVHTVLAIVLIVPASLWLHRPRRPAS